MAEEEKSFIGINCGKGKIDVTKFSEAYIGQLKPIELYMKEDGAVNNKPSFCFILERRGLLGGEKAYYFAAQISLEMLNEGLSSVGYMIKKKETDGAG